MPHWLAVLYALVFSLSCSAARPQTKVVSLLQLESTIGVYEDFLRKFGTFRLHDDGTSFQDRVELFHQRRQEVNRHNRQPGALWVAAVNKFSDHTDAELRARLGHRSARRMGLAAPQPPVALLEPAFAERELAQSMDWRQRLNTSLRLIDQGACGSCWAVAAIGALEMHAELVNISKPLSYQELVDCSPNKEHCGGTGGCKGSTAELAFAYIKDHGISESHAYDGKCANESSPILGIGGFIRLETNKLAPLLRVVAEKGPVVVSTDAASWFSYSSGVFDACWADATINHAVVVMGYGADSQLNKDYWLIRNSWGPDWGENGFIRLLRHSDEHSYCGTDYNPLEGVGCVGGPPQLPVCGMCGVLSDSSYPFGVHMVV